MDARPGRVSRMEIVESGRRRRFTDEAKLAIMAESYSGLRQVTATAQRHGITRWQLNGWRRAAREGRLDLFHLLDAERALNETERDRAEAYRDWGIAYAELERLAPEAVP